MPSDIEACEKQILFLLELLLSSKNMDSCSDKNNSKRINYESTKNSKTALFAAVRKTDIDCVRVLIDAGSEIDAKDEEGNTPLMVALRAIYQKKNDNDIVEINCKSVKILNENGAKFEMMAYKGNSGDAGNSKKKFETIFQDCLQGKCIIREQIDFGFCNKMSSIHVDLFYIFIVLHLN